MQLKNKKEASLLIVLCWLIYTCSYVGKLGYSANIGVIEQFYGVTHAKAGLVSTCFFIAYGIGQVVNGFLCKRYDVKYVVFGALLISGACNLLIGLQVDFLFHKYLWLVNGVVLAVLWPLVVRLLAETLPTEKKNSAIVAMGTSVAVGTFLVYGISALFVKISTYRLTFLVAAALLPAIAVVWLLFFKRLTKPLYEAKRAEEAELESKAGENGKAVKSGGFKKGVIPYVLILIPFCIVTNLVKDGLNTWVPVILSKTYALDQSLSILLTLFLPVIAIFGTAFAVKIKKKINDFTLMLSVFFIAALVAMGGIILFLPVTPWVTLALLALCALLMSATNNTTISMAPLYWSEKVNAGLLAGLLNGFCYVGSALSSYGLGAVADKSGWNAVFWLLFACLAAVTAVGVAFCLIMKKPKPE